METLIAWMVAIMLAAAPHYTSYVPEAVETPAEMQETIPIGCGKFFW